ncbi:MAG: hypothetical protein KKI08_27680, partial [Armatimonadetes bacterium]|nr:hypothetical protein [Armatimonadota bacterium]
MRRLSLIFAPLLLLSIVGAQQPPTYTVKLGAFPWHDRVNQWALSQIPDQYVADQPVPQQSCTNRNIVVPEGTKKATIAVLDKQLAEFLTKQTGATDTGDKLQIKMGGQTLDYAIVTVANPPAEMKHAWLSAGLILLGLEPALNGGGVQAPALQNGTPAPGEYIPGDKAAPWHDRVGQWVINKVPPAYQNLPPVPQQGCGAKTLFLPPGTKGVTVAVSDTDLPEFQRRFPQIKDTGLDLSVEPPAGGTGLPYSIVTFPDPPEKGDFRDFAKGGIVLLKLDAAPAA